MRSDIQIGIGDRALVKAIQAVANHIRTLRAGLAEEGGEPEEYQELEEWIDAANDLEHAYNQASHKILNLPPYDLLIA